MNSLRKLLIYINTIKFMKVSQVYHRVRKMMKMKCSLGNTVGLLHSDGPICMIPTLDFDTAFLSRFQVAELMDGRITLLHESEKFPRNQDWDFPERSSLWNYNLHYFEYLFPLLNAWKTTGNVDYLRKIQEMIGDWIRWNPKPYGSGWASYTISQRLVNWLNCYAYIRDDLDKAFEKQMLVSMQEQYRYLAIHLEKDLLGNHYFENLKALIICGLFFRDERTVSLALRELKTQCQEQILPDGMHFELSPMYHKIILEDMLRITATLQTAGMQNSELEAYLQPMLNVAYSLEKDISRIPLFNDCGNNVAKSLDALLKTAKQHFNLLPQFRKQLPYSGFYIFEKGDWKLIVDAGQPGPPYIPGHAHCDAMSFELFHQGQPVLVNCGTYAYQCEDRLTYKNTASHNTVMRNGVEQSQCWSRFRMGNRAQVRVIGAEEYAIAMEMKDQKNGIIRRTITFAEKEIVIQDSCAEGFLQAFFHCDLPIRMEDSRCWCVNEELSLVFSPDQTVRSVSMNYAPDYGWNKSVDTLIAEAENELYCCIRLP